MKTIFLTKLCLLSITLFALSCVPEQEPCVSKKDPQGSVSSSTKACQDPSGGMVDPKPTPIPEPTPTPAPRPDPKPTPAPGPKGDAFNRPWDRGDTSIVIDAYELNSIDWNKMSADTKMIGVIHRSSIGLRADTKYEQRREIASDRGYLWGAYHLGSRGNTIQQADFFLSIVGDEPDTLLVLDLEDTNASNFMSLDEAIVFMEYVYEKTGKIPVVYANHSTTQKLNAKVRAHPLFQQAKLWYARFKANVTDFPFGVWDEYFLWQFSSEINCTKTGSCLYNVPGTSSDMDINVFNGPAEELRSQWNND
ncbi:MAG: hypothetical protein Fur0010_21640 [Bdellovibrio sp.]